MEQIENTPTTTSVVDELPAKPEPKQKETRKYRAVVRNLGVNRTDRRRFARGVRLQKPVRMVNGREEMIEPKLARDFLKHTPKNVPIRRTNIDGRNHYVFEPHHQEGLQAYRAAFAIEAKKLQGILNGEKPTEKDIENLHIAGSKAYVDKVMELARPKAQEPEKAESNA